MLNPVSASKNNIVALAFVFPQSYVFVLSVFCIMLCILYYAGSNLLASNLGHL